MAEKKKIKSKKNSSAGEEKIIKKVVVKKTSVKKTITKKKPESSNKTVTSTVRVKNNFGIDLMNIVAIVIIIAILALGGILIDRYNQNKTEIAPTVQSAQSINYDCPEGQTALATLKEKADVKTIDSSFGVYVDEINGATNGDGSFWIFYVNGQIAEVGPDQYKCQANDKIEWRYENIVVPTNL